MKIIMNTESRLIREKSTRSDRYKSKDQIEADIFNIFAVGLAGKIIGSFKTVEARKQLLDHLYQWMLKMIEEN